MKLRFFDRHKPILTALKRAGLKVDEVVEQDKRIVITVSEREPCISEHSTEGMQANEK